MAAAATLVGTAGTALAATHHGAQDHAGLPTRFKVGDHNKMGDRHHEHANIVTGTVTAITPTTITLGTTTYTLDSQVDIRFGPFDLTTATVPLNSTVSVRLDKSGNVSSIWLHQDANLPNRPFVVGAISAIGTATITVDGYTLPVASNVMIREEGQSQPLSLTSLAVNDQVMLHLNRSGQVTFIAVRNTEANPNPERISGSISADTATSVTINGTTYPYATNVQIQYRDYSLTPAQVPTGSNASLQLNSSGQITSMKLMTDANLPSMPFVTGTISAVTSTSVTIGSYTLTLAPQMTVVYTGATSLTNAVTTGETAAVHLNSSGQVDRVIVGTGANVGPMGHHGTSKGDH